MKPERVDFIAEGLRRIRVVFSTIVLLIKRYRSFCDGIFCNVKPHTGSEYS